MNDIKRILEFLKSTSWPCRILFLVWVGASFFSLYARTDGIPKALIVYGIIFMLPAIGIDALVRLSRRTKATGSYIQNSSERRYVPNRETYTADLDTQISEENYCEEEDNCVNLENEELDDISLTDGMEGHEFEYYCADLLEKVGFVDVLVTRGSGDQGVDILTSKGGVKYAIQCKSYASTISTDAVQQAYTGKEFYRCHVGVVMTNSTLGPGATKLAENVGVLIWDRTVLQEMIEKSRESIL